MISLFGSVFQQECVDGFVASWRARGFSQVTIDNDIGLLERARAAPDRGDEVGCRFRRRRREPGRYAAPVSDECGPLPR